MYQLPPRATNKGYRAADWKLDKPTWLGMLRVVSVGSKCYVRLLEKHNGELFAQCDVDEYPGKAVEPVTDSSRYYVLRLDDGAGRKAYIGLGFAERSDSFDFNVSLRDHFKHEENEAKNNSDEPYVAKHQTGALNGPIKINIKKKTKDDNDNDSKSTPSVSLGNSFSGLSLQAPADLWGKSQPPSAASNPFAAPAPAASNPFAAPVAAAANPFADAAPAAASTNPFANANGKAAQGGDDWGDFTSGSNDKTPTNWVKFD